jgi:hypothetical protein
MVIVARIYLRVYIEVGVRVSTFLQTPTPPKIPSDADSTSLLRRKNFNSLLCVVQLDETVSQISLYVGFVDLLFLNVILFFF